MDALPIARPVRIAARLFPLGAIVVAALLLGSSTAGATAPSTAVVLAPPFKGSVYTISESANPLAPTPCTTAKVPITGYWHSKAGRLGLSAFASVRSSKTCTGPYQYSYSTGVDASAASYGSLSVPIGKPPSTGSQTITINWTFAYTVQWNVSHAPCPSVNLSARIYSTECEAKTSIALGASSSYYGDPELVDLSTGAIVAYGYSSLPAISNSSEWYRYTYCSSVQSCTWSNITQGPLIGRLSGNLSGNTTFRSVSLSATQHYALEFFLEATVSVTVVTTASGWGARAVASADLASGGNGFFLRSVTIT